jgi:hypothetical protein
MSRLGFASPGISSPVSSQTNQFIWGGSQAEILHLDFLIDSAARDAGSNNTQVLRAGLAMGRVTASGKLKQFDVDALDGTQTLVGFLKEETPLINTLGQAQEAFAPVIVKAPVKAKKVIYKGVTIVGHADETDIRTAVRARFLIDDEI